MTLRLGVVLDFGAAAPLSILAAARGLCEVIFVCDRDLRYVRHHFAGLADLAETCDITGLSEADTLVRLRPLGLAGITTFSEARLNQTAALAHPSGWRHPDPGCARLLTDKFAQRRRLAEAGVEATRCRVVRDVADLGAALAEVGLPAVLKPRTGAASAYTGRVDNPEQAASLLLDFAGHRTAGPGDGFVVEEMLVGDPSAAGPGWGDYVSVESVTSHGVVQHVEVTGKFPLAPPFRETGYFVPAALGSGLHRQVLDLAGAAIAALGVRDAVTHVEVKLTPTGPRIIEVNGRLGGYVADLVRRARGYDLVRAALQTALGRTPEVPPAVYRRFAFQYFITPPIDAVALRHLEGVEELLRRPGIQAVEMFAAPGDRLDWRRGTLTYLGIVHGAAADHRHLRGMIDAIEDDLRIEYDR